MINYTYKTEFGSTLGVVASTKEEAKNIFAEFFPTFTVDYDDIQVEGDTPAD